MPRLRELILKPCPFCGGTEVHYRSEPFTPQFIPDYSHIIFHYISCFDCDCRTDGYCDEDAAAYGYTGAEAAKQLARVSWNRRAS